MSQLSTHVAHSKMLFESKNDYYHNSSKIQLCLTMVLKVDRADYKLTDQIFHNRLTFYEDLLENAFYKRFLKEALMSHLNTHMTDSKMLFEAKNDYFHYPL